MFTYVDYNDIYPIFGGDGVVKDRLFHLLRYIHFLHCHRFTVARQLLTLQFIESRERGRGRGVVRTNTAIMATYVPLSHMESILPDRNSSFDK